jgi:nucleoside-diphosphate-sugar epimerase
VIDVEAVLSEPSDDDRAALSRLDGDLLILGAGGKMGPTLAMLAKRACPEKRVIAVSRFANAPAAERLRDAKIEVIASDLLDDRDIRDLPDAPNIVLMAGQKFGTSGNPGATWARNVVLPAKVCERFPDSRFVVFSSGNIYAPSRFGATEETPPDPVGEYAQTVLGRERIFQYYGARACFFRLNYAVEFRYGVLLDIGLAVFERRPVDLAMGRFNCIWQRDANSIALRAFSIEGPLNVTGPETISVRWAAEQFGRSFGTEAAFRNEEGDLALLSDASQCIRLFGYPRVGVLEAIERIAEWIGAGGETLGKPTHFEVTNGRY